METVPCPLCNCDQSTLMGKLGNVLWLRCRACGISHWIPAGEVELEEAE